MRQELLIIDPQFDFCSPLGNLYVYGAEKDMERLAILVKRIAPKLWDIHVTLDSHHVLDIAHPIFWKDQYGKRPNPFTIITAQDVRTGVWTPSMYEVVNDAEKYVEALESNARYPLCIWPPHCLIGSLGATVMPDLFSSLCDWEESQAAIVDYVTKGSNFMTEHYSAVMADVPDPSDPGTQLNTRLINILKEADQILIAGEASSHCLKFTIEDIANNFGEDNIKKLVLLVDAMSPVTGFEKQAEDFIEKIIKRGAKIAKTTDL